MSKFAWESAADSDPPALLLCCVVVVVACSNGSLDHGGCDLLGPWCTLSHIGCLLCSPLHTCVDPQASDSQRGGEEELGSLLLSYANGGLFQYVHTSYYIYTYILLLLLSVSLIYILVRGGYMLTRAGDFIKPLDIVVLLNTIPTLILFSAYMIVLLSWAQLYHASYL